MVQSEHAYRRPRNPEERIFWTDPPGDPIVTSGRTNVKRINEPQDQIICTSNESKNPQDWTTETIK